MHGSDYVYRIVDRLQGITSAVAVLARTIWNSYSRLCKYGPLFHKHLECFWYSDVNFFICYHSKESSVLIDMFAPGLFKIPEGSRGALPGALGCLCQPGPSFPVARCKSGVPTVQNEQGRKWDIQLTKSGAREVFAEDLDVFRT